MSRIALIPVAIVLAAGSVVVGSGQAGSAEPAHTSVSQQVDTDVPATTVVSTTVDSGVQSTNR